MRGGADEPLQSVEYDFDREQEGGTVKVALAGDLGLLLDSKKMVPSYSKPGSSIKKKGGSC
jgi:hypothetical protein